LAEDDQMRRGVIHGRQALDGRGQPLALEAAPHEDDCEGPAAEPGLAPRRIAIPGPVSRIEALEVDAVIHHREPRVEGRVAARDLGGRAPGDGHDAGSPGKHAALQGEGDAVIDAPAPRAAEGREVGTVTSLSGAIDILGERALVTLHDVPSTRADG